MSVGLVRDVLMSADEEVGRPAADLGEPAVVEGRVSLEVEVVEVAAFGVGVDAVAELLEDDVVEDCLGGRARTFWA